MPGYVDIHCHVVPGVDDGVRTMEEALALARGLRDLGFEHIVATPHIKTVIFENRRETIAPRHAALVEALAGDGPVIEFAAEHWCDDVFWDLMVRGEALRYPAQKSLLLEFDPHQVPIQVEHRFFEMRAKYACRPILAHPERYAIAWGTSFEPLERLLDAGALFVVNLASVAGRCGRRVRRAAEGLLERGMTYALCSDAHAVGDVEAVDAGLRSVRRIVGEEETERLLVERPHRIRDGRFDDV